MTSSKAGNRRWIALKMMVLLLILLSFSAFVSADCADLDADGIINSNDELIIKEQWHKNVDCCNTLRCGDINCDGIVDIEDLLYWSKRTNIRSDCADDYELFVVVISSTSKVVSTTLEDSIFIIELENPEGTLGVTNIRTNERPTRAIINEIALQRCNGRQRNCWSYNDNVLTLNYNIPKSTIKLYFKDIDFIIVLSFTILLIVIIIILFVTHRPFALKQDHLRNRKQNILYPNMLYRGSNQQHGK